MKFNRVNKKRPCRICSKADWCGISSDGKFAVCMRVESDKPSQNGGWVHVLIEDEIAVKKPVLKPTPAVVETPEIKKRSADELDKVYSGFLDFLVLSEPHKAELKARGLGEVDIHLHGYKSMPTYNWASAFCRRMEKDGFNFRFVPGFYSKRDKHGDTHFVDYFNASGYLIPIRNAEHKIVGLQLRRDDDRKPKYLMISSADKPRGASSGTPPHFAVLGIPGARSSFSEIIVTEGALKANIIAAYTDTPTVGLVGVGCFDENFGKILKDAFPNLETVKIAFDMDWLKKEAVNMQRNRLVLSLQKINLKVRLLSWNPVYKGLDDYLVNATNQKQKAA